MVSAFLIPFRETLEATLIVGVILAYLHKTQATHLNRHVFWGASLAVIASIITAAIFSTVAGGFSDNAKKLFEGTTMLLAAGVLTYVIFWMASQKQFTKRIEERVEEHIISGKALGLAALSFFAVYREGVETILFMGATVFAIEGSASLLVAATGIAAAILVGFLVFKTALRFQLKAIFNATSVLLLLFAAGLTAHGVHEFQEAGVLPITYGKAWDTNWLLDEKSLPGTFAKALFGYNADPFELEVAAYVSYVLLIISVYFYWFKPRVS